MGSIPSCMAIGNRNRRHDQQDRGRLHEIARDQQQDIHHNQEDPRREPGADDRFRDHMGNAFRGQDMGEQHGIGHDEQQHDRDLGRIDHNVINILVENRPRESQNPFLKADIFLILQRPHIAIDKDRNDEGIDSGNSGSLGRSKDPAVNATHDDHHQQQAPDRLAEGRPTSSPREARFIRGMFFLRAAI